MRQGEIANHGDASQNIKFGKPNYDLLGQVTYNTSDGADWTKGTIMFDFPTFRPSIGDHLRFNEPFCKSTSINLQIQTSGLEYALAAHLLQGSVPKKMSKNVGKKKLAGRHMGSDEMKVEAAN